MNGPVRMAAEQAERSRLASFRGRTLDSPHGIDGG